MTIVDSDAAETAVVRDYLARLHAAGWGLAPARRDELVTEVREHIDEALRVQRQAGRHGEAVVRNVLERLGPPEEIVRAEGEGQPYDVAGTPAPGNAPYDVAGTPAPGNAPYDVAGTAVPYAPFGSPGNQAGPATAYRSASPWGPVEIGALLMLTLGVLMPVIGLIIGLALVWVSGQWTRPQKFIATAIGLLPALGLLLFQLTGL